MVLAVKPNLHQTSGIPAETGSPFHSDQQQASGNVELENAVHDNTKIIYIETPSNPLLIIADIEAVVVLAKSNKNGINSYGRDL